MSRHSEFGSKDYFNESIRHIARVTGLIEAVSKGRNLADEVNFLLDEKLAEKSQILPMVSVILREKLGLPFACLNLSHSVGQDVLLKRVSETCKYWSAVDLVCVYTHPYMGELILNPANEKHWASVEELKQNEFIAVYARLLGSEAHYEKSRAGCALDAFLELLLSKKDREKLTEPYFLLAPSQEPVVAPSAPPSEVAPVTRAAPIASTANVSLTPKYSVQVTNELFHNGNVESWKNIVESYQEAYSDCKIIIYHEGELIQDLNSLFKWGKVKRGGVIFFQIAGKEIKSVRRLQKYLHEAASSRFEVFMKHDVNRILQLF